MNAHGVLSDKQPYVVPPFSYWRLSDTGNCKQY